ncbi:hypothetical protein TNCV_4950771 [Trichonephila clavipes]|nr:hypothetical protein TNCV_4950771 [Trichonephila clavipes]
MRFSFEGSTPMFLLNTSIRLLSLFWAHEQIYLTFSTEKKVPCSDGSRFHTPLGAQCVYKLSPRHSEEILQGELSLHAMSEILSSKDPVVSSLNEYV